MKTQNYVNSCSHCGCCCLDSIAIAVETAHLKSAERVSPSPIFRGYESWESVAPSVTEDGIKSILANPVRMKA